MNFAHAKSVSLFLQKMRDVPNDVFWVVRGFDRWHVGPPPGGFERTFRRGGAPECK
jgi:hypothetical protein